MAQQTYAFDAANIAKVRRVTITGLALNIVLAVIKFTGGILGSSQAVVADAVHTLSDSVTDIAILVSVKHWSKPPDDCHPYGHRRIETLITALIAFSLFAVGTGILYQACVTLREQHDCPPGWIAFAAAVISIVSKETLFRWSARIGKKINSPAIVANAWHHRSDALSSLPAALAVAGAAVNPSWWILDHIGAVIVSVFIFKAAWDIGRPAFSELIDAGASKAITRQIEALVRPVAGVRDIHAIRSRRTGSGLHIDLHMLVDPLLTVREGHDIATAVKEMLIKQGPGIIDAVIHIEPYEP